MVAVSGETTAGNSIKYMYNKMASDKTGRRILEKQPRITSTSIDLPKLATYPDNTFGKQYFNMLSKYVSGHLSVCLDTKLKCLLIRISPRTAEVQ